MRGGPAVGFGRVLVLTDRHQSEAASRPLVDTVRAAADAGTGAIVFREKDLAPKKRTRLVKQVAAVLAPTETQLIVASDPDLAQAVGASGIHLASADPVPSDSAWRTFGRSCHSRGDVASAEAEGASWVTLSPIFTTTSKPGYGPALGVDALAGHPITVFALGGVEPANAAACRDAGAYGVAVMGAVMSATDPGAAVAALRKAMDE